jgi:hypothetical protein
VAIILRKDIGATPGMIIHQFPCTPEQFTGIVGVLASLDWFFGLLRERIR